MVTHAQFIEGSGLREILETCLLATIRVGAVVDVNQIKRARYCVQVTLCSLYRKLVDALKADGSTLDHWKWLEEKSLSSSMAHYWSLVIQIEILVFVHSIRESNFHLYVQSLRNLLNWFFALDHTNYARWLTIHVFDLISLPATHPDVYQQMLKGFFSFVKTKRPFSRMALAQVHEQNNKIIKGVGGGTSLLNTQDESALIMWETCRPEVARIVSELEDSLYNQDASSSAAKHEDNKKFRQKFNRDVESIYQSIPCNPFEMASLSTINNSGPFLQSVSDQLKQVLSTGESQVKFIQDSLLMQKTAITEKISKNKFPLLSIGSSRSTSINLGVPFMNKLRSAVEHRPARADELFTEELYGIPRCFSVDCADEMYHGRKSSIQERLPSCQQPIISETYRNAIIVEASPILRKLSNVSADNFYEFSVVFYNYVIR